MNVDAASGRVVALERSSKAVAQGDPTDADVQQAIAPRPIPFPNDRADECAYDRPFLDGVDWSSSRKISMWGPNGIDRTGKACRCVSWSMLAT